MIILAKSVKNKEFLYSRYNAIEIPKSWSDEKINGLIDGLNKYFKLSDDYTYHKHVIDQYDLIEPDYKAYSHKGTLKIKRIYWKE